jgi:hypothetical protein
MADYWKLSLSGTLGELVAGLRNSSRILQNKCYSIITFRNCKMSFLRSRGMFFSLLLFGEPTLGPRDIIFLSTVPRRPEIQGSVGLLTPVLCAIATRG